MIFDYMAVVKTKDGEIQILWCDCIDGIQSLIREAKQNYKVIEYKIYKPFSHVRLGEFH